MKEFNGTYRKLRNPFFSTNYMSERKRRICNLTVRVEYAKYVNLMRI